MATERSAPVGELETAPFAKREFLGPICLGIPVLPEIAKRGSDLERFEDLGGADARLFFFLISISTK